MRQQARRPRQRTKSTVTEARPAVVDEVEGPPTVTAGWPLPRLLEALSRAGWGPFAGHYWGATRAILTALGTLLGPSGQGLTTAPQIADAAGYSEKWVRRKLHELEDAGVLTWDRGGIVDGRPSASWVRVHKSVLADVVNRARSAAGPKVLERARETARRIAEAGLRFTKSLGRKRRGPSGTQKEPLPPRKEVGGREPARPATGTLLNGPRPTVGSRWAEVQRRTQQQAVATATPRPAR